MCWSTVAIYKIAKKKRFDFDFLFEVEWFSHEYIYHQWKPCDTRNWTEDEWWRKMMKKRWKKRRRKSIVTEKDFKSQENEKVVCSVWSVKNRETLNCWTKGLGSSRYFLSFEGRMKIKCSNEKVFFRFHLTTIS
jgi:hypothetical protein